MRECFLYAANTNTRSLRNRLHSTNSMLQKVMRLWIRKRKIDQLIAKIIENVVLTFRLTNEMARIQLRTCERWPGARSILQPCNCHRSGRRVRYYCYRVVSSGIFLFLFSAETSESRTRLRPCVDGRRTKETAKRVVSDGNRRGRPSAIELSAGFDDRKDIAHVTGVARSIVATFLRLSALFFCRRSRDSFFSPARRRRGPFKMMPLTRALCLRGGAWLLIERSVSGTTRHRSACSFLSHGRFLSLAPRDDGRPNWCYAV